MGGSKEKSIWKRTGEKGWSNNGRKRGNDGGGKGTRRYSIPGPEVPSNFSAVVVPVPPQRRRVDVSAVTQTGPCKCDVQQRFLLVHPSVRPSVHHCRMDDGCRRRRRPWRVFFWQPEAPLSSFFLSRRCPFLERSALVRTNSRMRLVK